MSEPVWEQNRSAADHDDVLADCAPGYAAPKPEAVVKSDGMAPLKPEADGHADVKGEPDGHTNGQLASGSMA